MVYARCTTRLVVNHTVAEDISLSSPARQGCPFPPLLFSYLEPFIFHVTANDGIRGIVLSETEIKTLAMPMMQLFFAWTKRTQNRQCPRPFVIVRERSLISKALRNVARKISRQTCIYEGITWSNTPCKYTLECRCNSTASAPSTCPRSCLSWQTKYGNRKTVNYRSLLKPPFVNFSFYKNFVCYASLALRSISCTKHA